MAAYDDLDVKRIFVVGIASVVVTAVTALAVQVVYYTMAEQQKAETAAASNYMRQNSIPMHSRKRSKSVELMNPQGNL